MKKIWQLISPFWFSEEKYKAFGLFALILVLNVGVVYSLVMLNNWSSLFYNALQELDKASFFTQCFRFVGIVAIYISILLLDYYTTKLLSFRWRKWLTEKFIQRWLQFHTHYRLKLQPNATENPDQRISQDLESFSTQVLSLFISVFRQSLSLISFLGILWSLSGPLQFSLFGTAWTIPGYMVWAALLYALSGTYLTFKIGKPIVALDFNQEKYEANFRYALVRFREKSEEIAIYDGKEREAKNFNDSFGDITDNFYKILKRQMYIICCQNFYLNAATLFPLMAAAPMFFSKMITLGVLMQIRLAFSEVQTALSVLINNFQTIASLRATTQRLLEFSQQLEDSTAEKTNSVFLQQKTHDHSHLKIDNLHLNTPQGKPLIQNLNLSISAGEKVLIMGRSGFGKSTLLRAMAGVWPFGHGTISFPKDAHIMMIPQRSYLPLGSLYHALIYPDLTDNPDVIDVEFYLNACGLGYLSPHLHEVRDWSTHLSMGEQQRIIFVRILLAKPDWVILDEPTASMDKQTEQLVYTALQEHLSQCTIVTIGHAQTLKAHHHRVIQLDEPLEVTEDLGLLHQIPCGL